MCSEGIYDRYVNFYTDFAFKKLFGTEINKDLLISFLNALLQGREEIKNISYLNTEHLGTQEYDRRAVFDVYCTNERGEYFLVEMQKGEQQFFKDRSIYYSSFAMREQAPRGNWDYGLKAIYTIGILNFCFSTSTPSYYHEVKLMETDTKEVFYDKLTLIYLEMPKFTKTESELETLFDKWLYAIRNLASLMERPRALPTGRNVMSTKRALRTCGTGTASCLRPSRKVLRKVLRKDLRKVLSKDLRKVLSKVLSKAVRKDRKKVPVTLL